MSRREITFVSRKNVRETDLPTLGLDQDEIIMIAEDHWIMAHIMTLAGIFPSVGQARKNGWTKPIPDGFTMLTAGKLKHIICIWNPTEP